MIDDKQIILFDGVCNFCNYWIDFVIKRDKKDVFKFATLQSDKSKELTKNLNIDVLKLDTFILIAGKKHFTKSSAALLICKELNSPIKIFYLFLIIPKFIRDFIYDLIAKNRYKFFGRREICRVPTEEEKWKFLI